MAETTDASSGDWSALVAQLTAHSAGTILLIVFVVACYGLGFESPELLVAGIFVSVELAVLVSCGFAVVLGLGGFKIIYRQIVAAIQQKPYTVERSERNLRPALAGKLLVANAVLTAIALTYFSLATGGITISPFTQFLLIAIVFGQQTARGSNAWWQTLILGVVCFAVLLVVQVRHSIHSPGEINAGVYFGAALANLLLATGINIVERQARQQGSSGTEQ